VTTEVIWRIKRPKLTARPVRILRDARLPTPDIARAFLVP
jgi:hypothetical protein